MREDEEETIVMKRTAWRVWPIVREEHCKERGGRRGGGGGRMKRGGREKGERDRNSETARGRQ